MPWVPGQPFDTLIDQANGRRRRLGSHLSISLRARSAVGEVIAAASAGLFSLAAAAPLVEFISAPTAQPIYRLLSFICHQIPSRSPMLLGTNAGLCFRCMAIYGALAVGSVLPIRKVIKGCGQAFAGLLSLRLNQLTVAMAGVFILLLLADGLLPMLGWPSSTNSRRVVTGLLGGWGMASLFTMFRTK